MTKWYEAFAILDKYGLRRYDVYAEHDIITFALSAEKLNTLLDSPDWTELEEFGFTIDEGILYIYV